MTKLDDEIHRRRHLLARELAKRVPYDVPTCDRVLELALATDLQDPEEFLLRCSSVGLNPLEILRYALRVQIHEAEERSPEIQWAAGWRGGALLFMLPASIAFLIDAGLEGNLVDVGGALLMIGASIVIAVVGGHASP